MPGIPTCICFYSFYCILFIWRRDVFRPVSPRRDPGFRACLYERRDGTFTGTGRLSSRIYMNFSQAGQ